MNNTERTYVHRDDVHLMPWRIPAGSDGLNIDAVMIAVMEGDEMLSVSLHVDRGGFHESDATGFV